MVEVEPILTFGSRLYDEAGSFAGGWIWLDDVAGVVDGSDPPNLNRDPPAPAERAGCTDLNYFWPREAWERSGFLGTVATACKAPAWPGAWATRTG